MTEHKEKNGSKDAGSYEGKHKEENEKEDYEITNLNGLDEEMIESVFTMNSKESKILKARNGDIVLNGEKTLQTRKEIIEASEVLNQESASGRVEMVNNSQSDFSIPRNNKFEILGDLEEENGKNILVVNVQNAEPEIEEGEILNLAKAFEYVAEIVMGSCEKEVIDSTSPSKLTVVHRDGWCSSRARQDKQSHVELLRRDQARVKNIHQQAASPTSRLNPVRGSLFARVPANIGKAYHTVNYIITIGLGTPTKFFTVEFDTGSDLSWTQCAPCYNCYTQKDPFYDPTQSSTFSDILCTSDYCFDLDQFGCSSTSTCLFHEEYHDYSYTNGSFVQDTLTFSSDIIQNFRFGCGHNNTGQFGQLDGLLGLGRGAISIISQTAQLYNKVFSYCLPSRPSATGYLELGSSIPGVIYTPMLTDQDLPSFYFIKLIAISIGGSRLDLSPTVFTDPGTILDSGTVISYLPPTAYSALRNTFRQYMTKYPVAPPLPSLDTCYDLTNYTIMYIPSIALIFDGEVTTTLDSMGIVYGLSKSQVCLAFTENNDDSVVVVIGNVQQRRFNIVYDVGNLKIGFGANGCD
ncbi:Protein ASPARTIC PROTEASE IN GUARD CELL 2 [Dendrobium catenatum]|uniref:Protein ASPARTIC PROTEASE IN GUARD CELL 2 n=1 Tax=Dendrobium catenatum TaxID=906689 RepID=A0A2I0V8C0_9ASPA|nr:Protein ASPARTIC PROTEASE IN GUARD CELL 2 [Dendrobium catenatum]